MLNLTVLSTWQSSRHTLELVYSSGAHDGNPFGIVRTRDGALLGAYPCESEAKLALYALGAVPIE